MKQISFVTNSSVNTLDHLKLLLRSLKENLDSQDHEIIVFVDSDNENTLEYLKSIQKDYNDLKIISHDLKPCVGYSRNNNILVEQAKHDVVSYLQSDMVVSPHYDTDILSEVKESTILSSTRVEPPLHGPSQQVIIKDFGVDPTQFDMKLWNGYSKTVKSSRSLNYFFAPITFYKKDWQKVGGYDTLFRRSREDSDLLQRFIHARLDVKQTFKAVVYHFSCVSSRGKNWFDKNNQSAQERIAMQTQADQIELRRFIRKWGTFNHGEQWIDKYDVDLVVKNEEKNLSVVHSIEPYFSRVWMSDDLSRRKILSVVVNEHTFANTLLNFSEKNWIDASKFYNQTDYEKIFLVGQPEIFNIKIELDFSKKNEYFFKNIIFLHELIKKTNGDPGVYEMEDVTITINKSVVLTESYKIENPSFDNALLHIYNQ
jgi:glycosyltransferase involved in cell wall biosynthesis